MFCETFVKNTAATLAALAKIAARTFKVEGSKDPKWAPWEHAQVNAALFSGTCFAGETLQQEVLMVALLAKHGEATEDSSDERPRLAMSHEEISAWLETPAARELMAFADERYKVWKALYEFDHTRRKQFIGEYRGIPVFTEASSWDVQLAAMTEQGRQGGGGELKVAEFYVDAAFSLRPDFRSAGFNAEYGRNNLSYLAREYDETGQLYRVFVPFIPEAEGSPEVKAAKDVALMRAVLEPPTEPEYPLTPEVQRLLDLVPPYEEEE